MPVANVEITVDESLRSTPQLYDQVEQYHEQIERILGESRAKVAAKWERKSAPDGTSLAVLRLEDYAGSAEATFTSEELRNPSDVRIRFYKLWGDLLRIRSHEQLKKLFEE